MAREGRVEDLQAMLSKRKASLRDRDMNGISLLHHAVSHAQPQMCRFLINSGGADHMDVNEIAGKSDQAESLPLLVATTRATTTTSARGSAEFEATKECIEILLEAGGDPTMSLKSWDSPFHVACTPKNIDILDIFLDQGGAFAHIELADSRGRTQLLRMCSWYSTYTRQAFTYLIGQRGADIKARDHTGVTCLHIAIENAKRPAALRDEFDALAYLVRCGADVHAITATEGISVSEVAYTTSSTDVVYKLGSYRGDLWDAVLASVGHKISSFGGNGSRPGKHKFTASYTRDDFDRLWSGREHFCPYYSDFYDDNHDGLLAALNLQRITITSGPEAEDTDNTAATATAQRRHSLESGIRQRTDISVTVESIEKVMLNNIATTPTIGNNETEGEELQRPLSQRYGYDQYEGSCVSSHASSNTTPNHQQAQQAPPLLWNPSLVHHLMPNPWHDIISEDQDQCGGQPGTIAACATEPPASVTTNSTVCKKGSATVLLERDSNYSQKRGQSLATSRESLSPLTIGKA